MSVAFSTPAAHDGFSTIGVRARAGRPTQRHDVRMTRALASVLTTGDLPLAELHAARLDGELFAIDECFAPVDTVDTPALRGAALLSLCGPRAIGVLESALWVHGVLHVPPAVHQVRVHRTERTRLPSSRRLAGGERQFALGDVQVIGGMSVATEARCLVDLLFGDEFGPARQRTVTAMLRDDISRARACVRRIRDADHLPGKRRALQRLGDLTTPADLQLADLAGLTERAGAPAQPALTR